jgi:acylphosphatase
MYNFIKFIPESQLPVKHINIRIRGRVQGVGFRYSAVRAARAYNISGFVRNEGDGSVYIEAEGDELNLELFLEWCRKGPGYGRVDELTAVESGLRGFEEFQVLH